MSFGFLQLSRDPKVDELLEHSPSAFLLATLIARRARRTNGGLNPHGLEMGEALVGDHATIGLTRQAYRTAKDNLQKWGLATFRTTNKGTIAKLVDSTIYDINAEDNNQPDNQQANHPSNQQATSGQPTANQQATTNEECNNEKKGKNEKKVEPPLPAAKMEKTDKAKADLPTITAFCAAEEIPASDATWFFHKCEGNGWSNGGKTIKDWRSVLRAWKAAGYLPSQKPQRGSGNGWQSNHGPAAPTTYDGDF